MQPREPLFTRLFGAARHLRYKWFGKGPTPEEWEARLERVVESSVARSLPWIPRERAVLLDVGANIGVFTEQILRARPGCRAYLFEPVRVHYEACAARFSGNPDIVVENCALGDVRGPMTIWKPKHNPGGNLLTEELMRRRRRTMDFRAETVECRIFDEFARERGVAHVDFVKSDTEGFDYRVLRGMLGFLERCEQRPVILAELLPAHIHHDYAAQLRVIEALYGLGYQAVDLERMTDVEDFLFVPEGRVPLP